LNYKINKFVDMIC